MEAIRAFLVAKRSGRSTRTQSLNQLRHLGFCAPDQLRQRFHGLTPNELASDAAALRPRRGSDSVVFATKTAMHRLRGHLLPVLA